MLICELDMTGERKHEIAGESSMYSCLQCSSKFKHKFNLTRHIKTVHTSDAMYSCLQCSSKFKHKFNLTRHIKTVHTSDEFKCDQCESSFGRKDD